MDIPKPIAPDRLSALNVGVTMPRLCALSILLPRRHAPYATEPTRRFTKVVTSTAAFKQLGVLPPPRPQSPVPRSNTPPVDTTDDHHFPTMLPTQPPVQQSTSPPASFGHVVASGPQPVDLAAQLSTFLNEFNSLFTQLMQQTGAILSMLTAVLPRLTN